MKRLKKVFLGLGTAVLFVGCSRPSDRAEIKMAPPGVGGAESIQEFDMNNSVNYPNLSSGMSYAFINHQRYHVEISDDAQKGKLWLPNGDQIQLKCNGDTRGSTKCSAVRGNKKYEFSAPIRHGFGVEPYEWARLTTRISSTQEHDDGLPIHRDPVYGERHLTSQEQQVVVHVMRNFAMQTRAAGQFLYCRDLAAQTENHLIKDGWIYPSANDQEKVAFLLTANLIGLEGLCQQ